jgi:hypothetical protein
MAGCDGYGGESWIRGMISAAGDLWWHGGTVAYSSGSPEKVAADPMSKSVRLVGLGPKSDEYIFCSQTCDTRLP